MEMLLVIGKAPEDILERKYLERFKTLVGKLMRL